MIKKDTKKQETKEKNKKEKDDSFAVIKTGGKQYLIRDGDVLLVEKIEKKDGDKFELEDVLLVAKKDEVKIGMPKINQKVSAKVLSQEKGKKITIFKMKAKKRYRKTQGHRQKLTKLQIEEI